MLGTGLVYKLCVKFEGKYQGSYIIGTRYYVYSFLNLRQLQLVYFD